LLARTLDMRWNEGRRSQNVDDRRRIGAEGSRSAAAGS
jgi:hypothetical protein